MLAGTPRKLVDGLVFPEGPRWHDGRLWLVDMHAHQVLSVGVEGDKRVEIEFDDQPSGMGWLPDGTLLVASVRKRVIRAQRGDRLELYADLAAIPGDHLNDMVVDGRGNAYVNNRIDRGSTRKSMEPSRTTEGPQEGIVLVRPDRRPELVAKGLLGPNGSVVTPDGQTLIVAEAKGHRIMAYRIAADGRLDTGRVFADLPREFPDGICLDAEGAVWFGSPLTHEYGRVLDGGEVTERIPVPDDTWGIAPALGGPDRRTLFMCNAITDLENLKVVTDFEGDLRSGSRGWVGAVEVDVPGAGWP